MRKKLTEYKEVRGTFTGTFIRTGCKNGYRGQVKTVLLGDIKDKNGVILTDHLWFNYTKGFEDLGELEEGDTIQFNARCREYEKGYKGYMDNVYKPIEKDYKLSYPTKIKKLNDEVL